MSTVTNRVDEEVGEDSDHTLFQVHRALKDMVGRLKSLRRLWSEQLNTLASRFDLVRYRAPLASEAAGLGRPKFEITSDQLDYLRSLSFSWTEISHLIGVSRMTIYRRRVEYGMMDETSRTLSDEALSEILRELRVELPELGETMAAGRLRSMGYRVPRQQLRESLRRSDPLNVALRWNMKITRRPYSVLGPNSLWHIGKLGEAVWACSTSTVVL